MSNNRSLNRQKDVKSDDFYTELSDIEKELKHYQKHFKNKIVYCNCDDPRVSNFFKYFSLNFEKLGLKKLITTCYKSRQANLFSKYDSEKAIYLEYDGDRDGNRVPDLEEIGIHNLKSDGDFRNQECIDILKKVDIVCTNPPFPLFREYVTQLMKYKKKFLIIGNQNAITYKETFKLLKENKMWLGYHFGDMKFKVPSHYTPRKTRYWQDDDGQKWRSLGTVCWFTNLDHEKRHEDIILYKKYKKTDYPKYDNYNAINVNKINDIPVNYKGKMGVPITFVGKYNPDQIDIIGKMSTTKIDEVELGYPYINNKRLYARIIIKHKRK